MYNLDEIKQIPCSDVASKYGIELKESNGKLWGKLRSYEKTSSFNIDPKKNLWYDFGISQGGSVIDLVMEVEGLNKEDAINKLAIERGFTHEVDSKFKYWQLTDNQYREIGIQPEKATMNFAYDLNKHTPEQLERWNEKYAMHVKELGIKYPEIYNKMIEKFAMEKISILRDKYYSGISTYYDPSNNEITKQYIKSVLEEVAKEINRKTDLLERSTIKTKHKYEHLKVNYEDDIQRIERQKQIAKGISNLEVNEEIEVAEAIDIVENEAIKKRLVTAYKELFKFKAIEHFSNDQLKALNDINRFISHSDNKFLSIDNFKTLYKNIGVNLEKLENDYSNLINEYKDKPLNRWQDKADKIKIDISNTKEMFSKCSLVVEGIKDATLLEKNESIKQNGLDTHLSNKIELSL